MGGGQRKYGNFHTFFFNPSLRPVWMDSLKSLDFSSFIIFSDDPWSLLVSFRQLFKLPLVVQCCDVICEWPLMLLLRTPMPYARFFGLLVQVGGVFQSRLLCTSPRLMCRSWAKTGRAYIDEKRASYPTFVTVCYGSTQNHQGEVMGLLIAWIVVSVWRHQSITDGDDDASPSADIALLHHMSPHYCHPIQWTVVTRLALKFKSSLLCVWYSF